jgi:hypothetical protein
MLPDTEPHTIAAAIQTWRTRQISLGQALVRRWLDLATLALQPGDLERAARYQECAVVEDERPARHCAQLARSATLKPDLLG